jgi:Zn-dependent M16 (insulinase) family peptidase
MLYRTKFDDTKRLKEIVEEMKSKMQMHFNSAGHSVAVDRASSYYSTHGLFKEITTGISFYQFMEDLAENFAAKADTVIAKFKELMQMIFTKDNLLISVTADEEGGNRFKEALTSFSSKLQKNSDSALFEAYDRMALQPQKLNEGFKAAMQVQYVARTGNFLKAGFTYTGALKVLKVILSYDYLWVNIRVKGGAYGCMCGFSGVDGDAYFTSYRDPNLRETNQIYDKIADYVENFTADERDITKYIIGTFSSLDAPLTPQANGKRSLSMYLAGISEEELQKERDEILNVTQEDIKALSKTVKAVTDAGYLCVIGNENKVMENKDLFSEVKTLIK